MSQLRKRIRANKEAEVRRLEKRDLKNALAEIDELKAHIQAIKRLNRRKRVVEVKPSRAGPDGEATVIAVASDWHIGQEITLNQTNGLNEYNVAIARQRAGRFFDRIVRLTNKERQDIDVTTLVLFLGGDFIEGSLHLDTIMGSDLSGAMNQIVEVQSMIQGGLEFLKKHGDFKKIVVVCADGNHGRVSTKQHFHSRRGNSLEYYMYYNLAQRYPEFDWVINESMLTYLPVYEHTIRFMHGDRISFGGVNGFYTYLHRRIFEWDTSIKASYTILGHLHQYTPTQRYCVNGSMCGYNSFAQALSARFEPPQQAFILWSKAKGPIVHMPILF